ARGDRRPGLPRRRAAGPRPRPPGDDPPPARARPRAPDLPHPGPRLPPDRRPRAYRRGAARMIDRPFYSAVVAAALPAPIAPVDFNRDIRPILSGRCFTCHGPDEAERKAELRLDSFEDATADRGGYAAIVPRNPDASELIYRVESEDEFEVMPPPGVGEPIS